MAQIREAMGDEFVVPGQRLGPSAHLVAGPGTYARGNFVHASIVGVKVVVEGAVRVQPPRERAMVSAALEVGQVVTARVIRVSRQRADLRVLCLGDAPLQEVLAATIRCEDVRAVEVDRVVMYEAMRPGDIVRAMVASLGDSRSYHLSTARADLGVIVARSEAGGIMVPLSWKEMQCPLTGAKELRKVSDVRQLFKVGTASAATTSAAAAAAAVE